MTQLEAQRQRKAITLLEQAFEYDPPYSGPDLERLFERQYEAVTKALYYLKLR